MSSSSSRGGSYEASRPSSSRISGRGNAINTTSTGPGSRRISVPSSDDLAYSTSEDPYESDDYFSYQRNGENAEKSGFTNALNPANFRSAYQFPAPPTKQLLRPHRHSSYHSQKYKHEEDGEGDDDEIAGIGGNPSSTPVVAASTSISESTTIPTTTTSSNIETTSSSSSSDNNMTLRYKGKLKHGSSSSSGNLHSIRANKSNNGLANINSVSSSPSKRYSRSSRHRKQLSNGTIRPDDSTPVLLPRYRDDSAATIGPDDDKNEQDTTLTLDEEAGEGKEFIEATETKGATDKIEGNIESTEGTVSTESTTITNTRTTSLPGSTVITRTGITTNPQSTLPTLIVSSSAPNTPIPATPAPAASSSITLPIKPSASSASIKKPGTMTVEAETVDAVPTLAVAPTITGTSSLKIKKSIDNGSRPLNRTKKKKSSRLGQGSKAEIFAAKIASAVDEVHSSDSDETFVYESNPTDRNDTQQQHHQQQLSNLQNQQTTQAPVRPRFQSRNPSSSSLPFTGSQQQLQLQQLQQQIQYQQQQFRQHVRDVTQPAMQLEHQQQQQQQQPPSSSLNMSTIPSTDPSANVGQMNRWVISKHKRTTGDTPMSSSSSITNIPTSDNNPTGAAAGTCLIARESRSSSSSKRGKGGGGSISRPQSPRPDEFGSPKYFTNTGPSNSPIAQRQHSSLSRPYDSTASSKAKDATFRRWRGGGSYLTEEDDDYDDQPGQDDMDDDLEYVNVSENTRLRSSGHSIRRSRKTGSLVAYSPHNYQRDKNLSHFYYFRVMFWAALLGVIVLATGFILGFLLATSKPLQDIRVSQIFDVLVSDEVLAFELVIEGYNPGYLGIEVQNVNLDLFAKSKHVKDIDTKYESSLIYSEGADDDESHTMLLGNVKMFDVPLIFEGGLFSRRLQKAVGDVKLINPGRNITGEDSPDKLSVPLSPSIWELIQLAQKQQKGELDDGQKKWSRVNVHSFDLILRGSLKYNLLFGRQRSASIAKVSIFCLRRPDSARTRSSLRSFVSFLLTLI